MDFEGSIFCEAFPAKFTQIWFLFGMSSSDMALQMTRLSKGFFTMLTLVWFLFGMGSYVLFKVSFFYIAFLTIFAMKQFLSGMYSMNSNDVLFEVDLLCKTFLAMLTLKRIAFLFKVGSDVAVSNICLCKAFLTILTLIRFLFSVSSEVFFQITT